MKDDYISRLLASVRLPGIALEELAQLPTADVAPVRHGRWELEENWETGYGVYVHVCTACNAITPVNVSRYRYCPNCGAKMDCGEKG